MERYSWKHSGLLIPSTVLPSMSSDCLSLFREVSGNIINQGSQPSIMVLVKTQSCCILFHASYCSPSYLLLSWRKATQISLIWGGVSVRLEFSLSVCVASGLPKCKAQNFAHGLNSCNHPSKKNMLRKSCMPTVDSDDWNNRKWLWPYKDLSIISGLKVLTPSSCMSNGILHNDWEKGHTRAGQDA